MSDAITITIDQIRKPVAIDWGSPAGRAHVRQLRERMEGIALRTIVGEPGPHFCPRCGAGLTLAHHDCPKEPRQ